MEIFVLKSDEVAAITRGYAWQPSSYSWYAPVS